MTRTVSLAVLLAGFFFSTASLAQVYRSDSGLGGALILPYWTVAAGNDTLVGVENYSDEASALKLRLLDEEGALVASFNLYLDARSLWGAALTRINDQSLLLPSEIGCVLPPPSASHNERPALPLAAPRGSIEVIEMGHAEQDSGLANQGRWADCDVLAEAFDAGAWSEDTNSGLAPPTQLISSQATLINVAAGGMNTVPATVIGGFSDIAQHTDPESALPDLAHAFDSGADDGGVRSLVCAAGGCRIDEWAQPIEAVAAVLMVTEASVTFSIDSDLAAKFEWLLHRPLKRYEAEIAGFSIGSEPGILPLRPTGRAPRPTIVANNCLPFGPGYAPFPGCDHFALFPLRASIVQDSLLFNASMDDYQTIIDSSVLGHPVFVWPGFAFGPVSGAPHPSFFNWFEGVQRGGSSRIRLDDHDDPLTAPDGTRFLGEPLISFAVQQFSNGTLTDEQGQNVLSNYRRTELPRQRLRLQAPD